MIQFGEKQLSKLSEITDVPYAELKKLYAMNLLHDSLALDMLINADFKRLSKTADFRSSWIIARLAEVYDVSYGKVKTAIYRKTARFYYCKKCQKRIPKSMFKRNNGICDSCIIHSIKI